MIKKRMDTKAFSVLHGRANKYCRFCMVDRNEDPTIVCRKRTREAPLQQMAEISSLRTEQAKAEISLGTRLMVVLSVGSPD